MSGCFLSKHLGENILLAIVVAGFLILPFSTLAEDVSDISSEEINQHLQMSSKESEALMHTLIQVLTDEMIDQYASPDSNAKKRAVPTILKKGVQVEALNYLLIDAPVNVGYKIVTEGIDLARIAFASDVSVFLERLEKKSVEKAVEEGEEWLFRRQIRTTPGTIEVEYTDKKDNKQKALFQYVLIYKPLTDDRGKLGVRVYSSKFLAAPKSEGWASWGLPNDLKKPLPPFTVTINGVVEKINYGAYGWSKDPNIKIRFPDHVPDLGIEPLSFWQRHLIEPVKSRISKVNVLVAKVTGDQGPSIKDNVSGVGSQLKNWTSSLINKTKQLGNNAWDGLKSGLSSVNPFSAQVVGTDTTEGPGRVSERELDTSQNEKQEQKSQDKSQSPKEDSQDEPDLEEPKKPESQNPNLDEIRAELDKIAQEAEKVEKRIKEKNKKENQSCIALNKASEERLKQIIGIGPATAGKIIKFRNSDQFYSLGDLTEISGVGPVTVDKIEKQNLACIETEKPEQDDLKQCIALNEASKERLQELTGIGPATADKIINFRKSNQIYSLDDLDQISGIGSVTISNIKSQGLACIEIEQQEQSAQEQSSQEQEECSVNINDASEEELQKITGIGPAYAGRIVENRNFASINDLTRVKGIGEVTLKKIKEQDCAYVEDNSVSYPGGGGSSNNTEESNPNEETNEELQVCSQEELTRATTSVVINEVAWMGNASSSNDEWVELNNGSDSSVALSGWQLIGVNTEDNENNVEIIFEEAEIATDTYYLLERTDDETVPGVAADKLFTGYVNNDNYALRLFDGECKLHSQIMAAPDWPAGSNEEELRTAERSTSSFWYTSNSTTSINGLYGTPKAKNSSYSPENEDPIAIFGATSTAKVEEEVSFNASSSSDPDGELTDFQWSFGGATTSGNNATVTHSFSEAGTTTVVLTVTDNQGATSSTSTMLRIEQSGPEEIEFADGLIISEVKTTGEDEFVELYNASSSAVEVSSLHFTYYSKERNWNDPWVANNKSFPTTTPIQPDSYYLIEFSEEEDSEISDSDWNLWWGYGLKDEVGSVGIFTQSPDIATTSSTSTEEAVTQAKNYKIDAVGWGDAIVAEGNAASAADKSLARRVATTSEGVINYIDTNNNASDFENATPSPGVITPNDYSDLDNDGIINSYDSITEVSTTTPLSAGDYLFNDLVIKDGAKLILESSTSSSKGVEIKADSVVVATSASISADGQGWESEKGAGAGHGYEGGSYGGIGERNGSTSVYGSVRQPTSLGSGGGSRGEETGGAGGGAIKIEASSVLVNGKITADGQNGVSRLRSGVTVQAPATSGGSGGSIYIKADTLAGAGLISANGGNTDSSGPGSGGRIAIHGSNEEFEGVIQVYGGSAHEKEHYRPGGAGTVYLKNEGQEHGDLIIDNNGQLGDVPNRDYQQGRTKLPQNNYTFDNIVVASSTYLYLPTNLEAGKVQVKNNAVLKVVAPGTITFNEQLDLKRSSLVGSAQVNLSLNGGDIVAREDSNLTGNFDITADNVEIIGSEIVISEEAEITNLLQTENALLKTISNVTSSKITAGNIKVKDKSEWQGNFNINANSLLLNSTSVISADGEGFSAKGGRGGATYGSGAGHGGFGGGWEDDIGGTYGSSTNPVLLGSGGGGSRGGSGGGSLQVSVDNLSLDGTLSANGADGRRLIGYMGTDGGGGSGGSIYIKAEKLVGSGEIKANGGDGYKQEQGAGAGGRVAVYFSTNSFATSSVEVQPGSGGGNLPAEPGSIFWGDGLLK